MLNHVGKLSAVLVIALFTLIGGCERKTAYTEQAQVRVDTPARPAPVEQPVAVDEMPAGQPAEQLGIATNEAVGIRLPAPRDVSNREQFVDIAAVCQGPVKWLVLTVAADDVSPVERVKYVDRGNNSLSVGIPQTQCTITVYAIGVVGGKATEFVRTDLRVVDNTNVRPPPTPVPTPPVVGGPYVVLIIEDASQRTPELAAILNSPTISQKLAPPNFKLVLLSINSEIVKAKGYADEITKAEAKHGKRPAWLLVLNKDNGRVLLDGAQPVPKTEDEFVKMVISAR